MYRDHVHVKHGKKQRFASESIDYMSKFYNRNHRNAFCNINFDGRNLTFKGYIANLAKTTKLASNAMELTNKNKNLKTLQRTSKFFTVLYDFIKFRSLDDHCFEDIANRFVRVWLQRIHSKNRDQTPLENEATDIECDHDTVVFLKFSDELKDLHECIVEIFMLSLNDIVRKEIIQMAHTQGYSLPQITALDTHIDLLTVIWQKFTKNYTNRFADLPSKINWGKCNFECAWNRYKNVIIKTGYIEQYPHRLGIVINEIHKRVSDYTDSEFLDNEIKSFYEEEDIFVSDFSMYRAEDGLFTVGQFRDTQYKWSVFCSKLDRTLQKHQGLGMFQKIKQRKKINELIDKAIEVIETNKNDSETEVGENTNE